MSPRPDELRKVTDVAGACVARVDQGHGKRLTWPEAQEVCSHPLDGLTKEQLRDVAAYLAAQCVGYRNSVDQDALHAMRQVARDVDNWRADIERKSRQEKEIRDD